MIRARRFLLLGLFATSSLLWVNSASAQWDPLKQVRDAGKRFEDALRNEAGNAANSVQRAHQLNFRLTIHNPTSGNISYYVGDHPYLQIGGQSVNWTGTSVGNPTIAFNNGRGQTVRYSLSRSGRYRFAWNNGVLDLFGY